MVRKTERRMTLPDAMKSAVNQVVIEGKKTAVVAKSNEYTLINAEEIREECEQWFICVISGELCASSNI